jgi:hypothetical protein
MKTTNLNTRRSAAMIKTGEIKAFTGRLSREAIAAFELDVTGESTDTAAFVDLYHVDCADHMERVNAIPPEDQSVEEHEACRVCDELDKTVSAANSTIAFLANRELQDRQTRLRLQSLIQINPQGDEHE